MWSCSRSTESGIAGVCAFLKFLWKLSVYSKYTFFRSAAYSGQVHFWFRNLLTGLPVSGIGSIGHDTCVHTSNKW